MTLDQVGQWHNRFKLSQNSNAPTMRLNTPARVFRPARPWMNRWAQVHLLFKHHAA